jgi:hypothetical protein
MYSTPSSISWITVDAISIAALCSLAGLGLFEA